MRKIELPNRMTLLLLALLLAISVVVALAGFAMEGDWGPGVWILGTICAATFLILLPIIYATAKKQVKEIEALVVGQNLLAHWTFDADEWARFTENEHVRGMQMARKFSLWTFVISMGVLLVIGLFSGLDGMYAVISLAISVAMTTLVGGIMFGSAKSIYAANQAAPGEVFISPTSVYFGNRYYSWARWARLQKVSLEPGDPSVVQFKYITGSGEQASETEVRVPVPRGREQEAQNLVASFYSGE